MNTFDMAFRLGVLEGENRAERRVGETVKWRLRERERRKKFARRDVERGQQIPGPKLPMI